MRWDYFRFSGEPYQLHFSYYSQIFTSALVNNRYLEWPCWYKPMICITAVLKKIKIKNCQTPNQSRTLFDILVTKMRLCVRAAMVAPKPNTGIIFHVSQVIVSSWGRTTCSALTTLSRRELNERRLHQLRRLWSLWTGPLPRENFWKNRASTWSRRWRRGTVAPLGPVGFMPELLTQTWL